MEIKILKVKRIANLDSQMAAEPTHHQHVGWPNNAAMGYLPPIKLRREIPSVASNAPTRLLQESRRNLFQALQPGDAANRLQPA
jgi:hypothetical protein